MSNTSKNKYVELLRDGVDEYTEYARFKILGRKVETNSDMYVSENPTIEVDLSMIKGVVKKIRKQNTTVQNLASTGVYYDEDMQVKIGKLDYEVLFTDDVKIEYRTPYNINTQTSSLAETTPLIDTKTGIKFYHISKEVYLELSELIEKNDGVCFSKINTTTDL